MFMYTHVCECHVYLHVNISIIGQVKFFLLLFFSFFISGVHWSNGSVDQCLHQLGQLRDPSVSAGSHSAAFIITLRECMGMLSLFLLLSSPHLFFVLNSIPTPLS
jgi:hypothetical protein